MYCVKCGVELGDNEELCPLCKTPVYHPIVKQLKTEHKYPAYVSAGSESFSKLGIMFIITFAFAICLLVCAVCDISINDGVTWSGYAVGAMILFYVAFVLPAWFVRPSPAIFVPVSFAACALYLCYVCYAVKGNWYLGFALPVILAVCGILTPVTVLRHYVKRGALYVYGGAFIAASVFCVFLEILIIVNFGLPQKLVWSYYPFIVFFLFGMFLILTAICRPLRESLKRKFFI